MLGENANANQGKRSINLDIGIKCTLLCPGCGRQNAMKGVRPIPGHDMTVEEFGKVIAYFDRVLLCGQLSDPIFNANLMQFIKMSNKANITLGVHTSASHKSMKWYEEAFDSFGKGYWTFGIDGMPEDSHKYRINQDGVKLFEVARMCAAKNIKTNWQYIVFRYNENDIERAKQLARDNNINFELIRSSRFGNSEDQLKYKPTNPDYYLERA